MASTVDHPKARIKCPVARNMMATPVSHAGPRPAPLRSKPYMPYENQDPHYPVSLEHQDPDITYNKSQIEAGDTGDDISDTDIDINFPTHPPQAAHEQSSHGNPANFTQGAAQKAAQAVGVGAAYAARHGLKAANMGAGYAVNAAKWAGSEASQCRLLSEEFWRAPIGDVEDGPRELMEDSDVGEKTAGGGAAADDMIDKCEKTREYDGKLRNRLLGGVNRFLTDTAMLFALSSSLTLNTLFRPLETQPRAYRGGIRRSPTSIRTIQVPEITLVTSTSIITSPSGLNTSTANQAKWVKLLLIDSMVLSLIALFIGYSAMGIVHAFNPWGWMTSADTGKPSSAGFTSDSIDEGGKRTSEERQGFKADFNDPSHAAQSSSLSQQLQLQARKTQFERLKMRLPLVYLFPRIFQVALLSFVGGFAGLMWFVWVNEVGFARYFKSVVGSRAVVPLVAVGVVGLMRKVVGVR